MRTRIHHLRSPKPANAKPRSARRVHAGGLAVRVAVDAQTGVGARGSRTRLGGHEARVILLDGTDRGKSGVQAAGAGEGADWRLRVEEGIACAGGEVEMRDFARRGAGRIVITGRGAGAGRARFFVGWWRLVEGCAAGGLGVVV